MLRHETHHQRFIITVKNDVMNNAFPAVNTSYKYFLFIIVAHPKPPDFLGHFVSIKGYRPL